MPRPFGTKRLFRFFSRSGDDIASDVREEFAFHLDMRAEELIREGLSEGAARAQARREFGEMHEGVRVCASEGRILERRRRVSRLAAELRQDLAFGVRLLVCTPGFSLVAIGTIALAIGGNTAIFSLVNALGFKGLPVVAAHEIVRVYSGQSQTSWLNYQDLRQRNTTMSDLAAHGSAILPLSYADTVARMMGESASANYLSMLGVRAMLGRTLLPADTRPDLIVLGERAWRTRFGSDPSIVGRTLSLGGRRFEVIGVMPRGFRGVRPPGLLSEFWIPIDPSFSGLALRDRGKPLCEIVGRLTPRASVEQAAAEFQTLSAQIASEHPSLDESFARAEVFSVDGFGGYRGMTSTLAPVFAFVALMTIVAGFVLLVGCANIAGLLLGRSAARRREIGVRLALGATRGRLIRQLLAESLLLSALGGLAGTLIAIWAGHTLNGVAGRLPGSIEFDLDLDPAVLVYTFGLAVLTALLCGLAPARRSTRLAVVPALKDDGGQPARQRMRRWLVGCQVAISCALLMWGGLFVRSLSTVHGVDPGFDPAGVLVASIQVDGDAAAPDAVRRLIADVQERVRAMPGVESAGISTVVPLSLTGREEYRVRPDADPRDVPGRWIMANRVTQGWFEALRIPVVAGRGFGPQDRHGGPRVALVNETLARTFWNGAEAVGRKLDETEVIGVVRDSKYWTLGEATPPTVYTLLEQNPAPELNLHVRAGNLPVVTKAIRAEIARLDPTLFADIKPMTDSVSAAFVPAQVGAALTSAFGVLAALLTIMGIYGLVSFDVAQRTREIGIRKAVGAQASQIVAAIVRGSLVPVTIGLTAGVACGILGALGLRGFIAGVSPLDPLTLICTVVVILATAVGASALPAWRTSQIDALLTLRIGD